MDHSEQQIPFRSVYDDEHAKIKNLLLGSAKMLVYTMTFIIALSVIACFIIFMEMQKNGVPAVAGLVALGTIMAVYLFIVYPIHARRSRKLSGCLTLIKDDHITSTEELADILGVRESGVHRLVSSLIRKGFLEGAEIDKAQHEIIFRKSVWAKQKAVCRYCGASLIVDYGHTLICDYCGQALSVESNNRTERRA